jgi:hypothetical protein
MASTITAGNATNGLALSCDNTGILELKTGTGAGTTAVTIGTGQQVAVTLGSAAAPAITFSGDTNTGIFSPAADTIAFSEGGVESMRIDASGRLLIGTTTAPSSTDVRAFIDSSGGGFAGFAANGTAGGAIGSPTTSVLGLYTAAGTLGSEAYTERARIDSSGNLLVGTTSTSFGTQGARMMATGQIQAVSASGNDAFAGYRQTTTAGNSIITGHSDVGGTQILKFNAMADGNVRIAAGATYGNISDAKYKSNIVDATPKLQDVLQLKVRNFNVAGVEQKAIGFVAQEFETVFPSLVIETADKNFDGEDLGTTTKGIKESALIPILTKAIQELKAELDATKAEVALLKGAA